MKLKKHDFPFGSAVKADLIADAAQTKYQDYFYATFWWSVLENTLKWRVMEWNKVHTIMTASVACPVFTGMCLFGLNNRNFHAKAICIISSWNYNPQSKFEVKRIRQ